MDDFIGGLVALAVGIAVLCGIVIGAIWLVGQVFVVGLATIVISIPLALLLGAVFLGVWLYYRAKFLEPRTLLLSVQVDQNCEAVDFGPEGDDILRGVDYTSLRFGLGIAAVLYVCVCLYLVSETPAQDGSIQFGIGTILAGIAATAFVVQSKPWLHAALQNTAKNALAGGHGCLGYLRDIGAVAARLRESYNLAGVSDLSAISHELSARLHAEDERDPEAILRDALEWIQAEQGQLEARMGEYGQCTKRYKTVAAKVNRLPAGPFLVAMDELYAGLHSDDLRLLLQQRRWAEFSAILADMSQELDMIEARADELEGAGSDSSGQQQSTIRELERICSMLGVSPDDDQAAIRQHVRKLLRDFHPDRNLNASDVVRAMAEERFKELNNAWERLQELLK